MSNDTARPSEAEREERFRQEYGPIVEKLPELMSVDEAIAKKNTYKAMRDDPDTIDVTALMVTATNMLVELGMIVSTISEATNRDHSEAAVNAVARMIERLYHQAAHAAVDGAVLRQLRADGISDEEFAEWDAERAHEYLHKATGIPCDETNRSVDTDVLSEGVHEVNAEVRDALIAAGVSPELLDQAKTVQILSAEEFASLIGGVGTTDVELNGPYL